MLTSRYPPEHRPQRPQFREPPPPRLSRINGFKLEINRDTEVWNIHVTFVRGETSTETMPDTSVLGELVDIGNPRGGGGELSGSEGA